MADTELTETFIRSSVADINFAESLEVPGRERSLTSLTASSTKKERSSTTFNEDNGKTSSPVVSPTNSTTKNMSPAQRFQIAAKKVQDQQKSVKAFSEQSGMSKILEDRKRHVVETAKVLFTADAATVHLDESDFDPTHVEGQSAPAPSVTVRDLYIFLGSSLDRTVNTPWTKDVPPFLICLIAITLSIFMEKLSDNTSPGYFSRHSTQKSLITKSYAIGDDFLTYNDINSMEQYAAWLKGPFAQVIFNSKPSEVNLPIGVVTIRQVRAVKTDCFKESLLRSVSTPPRNFTCYKPVEANGGPLSSDPYNGFYSDKDKVRLILEGNMSKDQWPPLFHPISGWVRNYPSKSRDQFSESFYVNTTATDFIDQITSLLSQGWLDDATRALAVHVTYFNLNWEYFYSVKLTMEITDGGGFEPWSVMRPVYLYPYATDPNSTDSNILLITLHVYIVLYFVYDLYRLGQRLLFTWVYNRRVLYLLKFWNIVIFIHNVYFWVAVEAKIKLLQFCSILQSTNFVEDSAKEIANTGGDPSKYSTELVDTGAALYDLCYSSLGVVAMMGWLRILLYVEHIPHLCLVSLTVRSAIGQLMGISLLLLVIIFGFSIMGHMYYGNDMEEFRTYNLAASTLAKVMLGEFPDWTMMDRIRPGWSTFIFLGTFIIVCWCILLNMVLAVITDAFYKMQAESSAKNEDLSDNTVIDSLSRMEHSIAKRCHKLLLLLHLDTLAEYVRVKFMTENDISLFGHMDRVHSLTFKLRDSITTIRNCSRIAKLARLVGHWIQQGKGTSRIKFSRFEKAAKVDADIHIFEAQWVILKEFFEEQFARDFPEERPASGSPKRTNESGSRQEVPQRSSAKEGHLAEMLQDLTQQQTRLNPRASWHRHLSSIDKNER